MYRRKFICALATITLIAGLPGCDSTTAEPEEEASITGSYTLQTVDGHAVPYTADGTITNGGSLTLNADLTWSVALTGHIVATGADNSFTSNGTYTASGTTLTLHASDGETVPGTIAGNIVTVTSDDSKLFAFKKN